MRGTYLLTGFYTVSAVTQSTEKKVLWLFADLWATSYLFWPYKKLFTVEYCRLNCQKCYNPPKKANTWRRLEGSVCIRETLGESERVGIDVYIIEWLYTERQWGMEIIIMVTPEFKMTIHFVYSCRILRQTALSRCVSTLPMKLCSSFLISLSSEWNK